MAFQGSGLISDPNSNYFSFLARKPNEGKIPLPSEMITGSSHTIVIDSRERNMQMYPNPATYSILFSQTYKNVTSIELKGSILPKTEYNVNTGNMFIPFNVQDFITSIKIKDSGYGYVDGTYGFGAVPPNDTLATITAPCITGGTQATVTVTVVDNSISTIVIQNPGSGYLRGFYGNLNDPTGGFYLNAGASFVNSIPQDFNLRNRFRQAVVEVNVGNELVAQLTPGQYDFTNPNDADPGLCREVTEALQSAVDNAIQDGFVVPVVGGPQTGAEYFPFPTVDPDDGSCYLITTNGNASCNVQVAIQRGSGDGTYTQDPFVELLWSAEDFSDSSAVTILGYGSDIKSQKFRVSNPPAPMDQTNNSYSGEAWSKKPIIGRNDYDLTDAPVYTILSFGEYKNVGQRLESTNENLDKSFATLVFDANAPDVIWRAPEATIPTPGTGPSSYSTLLSKPGTLKAIKGADFDTKILSFGPAPLAELTGITVNFRKFNGDLVDFHGRDHLLIFTISAQDINSGNKW